VVRIKTALGAIVGAFMTVTPATTAVAQITKPVAFSLSAGFSNPLGDFASSYTSGSNVTVSALFQQKSLLSFRVDGMFNEFSSSSETSGITRVWALSGNTMLTPANFQGPFLTAGLGAYNVIEPDIGAGSATSVKVGYAMGGGFRFALSGFDAFAQVQVHQAGDKAVRFVPITFGVVF
jgi:hypothetical protein